MFRNLYRLSAKNIIIWALFSLNVLVVVAAILINYFWFSVLSVTLSLFILALHHAWQEKQAILNNYPLIGYLRYFMEFIGPKFRQHLSASTLDEKPFNLRQRILVYQSANNEKRVIPAGLQEDSDQVGYEWIAHSAFPKPIQYSSIRVTIGNKLCTKPYSASILNIGAMSYGSLSKTAVSSLNQGAKLGGFAQNTGEGGISEYHTGGGDLIWQIGTGYFGCKDVKGDFCPELFKITAANENVKMIELKLSQGAKPGHSSILPESKNTPEIAAIRNVMPYTTICSPAAHSAFSNPLEMMQFIGFLRLLAAGKPVGFKLCIGDKQDFIKICQAMNTTGIIPDFITIDGAEDGTGASTLGFKDNIGMPLYDALAFVSQTLTQFGLKKDITLIASGKIITAFDILKVMALGAGSCYSSRGMMFAMGCIQALKCDSGHCPAGIATQNPSLYEGLVVTDKKIRVANFHHNTLDSLIEIMEACGFRERSAIRPEKFFRKIDHTQTKSFQEIYFNRIDDTLKDSWLKARMLN